MKKVVLSLVFALAAMTGWAQGIMGKWITEAGDAQVEIYQQGDKINGKIVWLQQGPETKDKHNPDDNLCHSPKSHRSTDSGAYSRHLFSCCPPAEEGG